jgi:hypothetical protein
MNDGCFVNETRASSPRYDHLDTAWIMIDNDAERLPNTAEGPLVNLVRQPPFDDNPESKIGKRTSRIEPRRGIWAATHVTPTLFRVFSVQTVEIIATIISHKVPATAENLNSPSLLYMMPPQIRYV